MAFNVVDYIDSRPMEHLYIYSLKVGDAH